MTRPSLPVLSALALLLVLVACGGDATPPADAGASTDAAPAADAAGEGEPENERVALVRRSQRALAEGTHLFALRRTAADGTAREGRLLLAASGSPKARLRLSWDDPEGETVLVSDGERVAVSRPGEEILTSPWSRAGTVLYGREASGTVGAAVDPEAFALYPTEWREDEVHDGETWKTLYSGLPNGGGWTWTVAEDDALPRRVTFETPGGETETLELTPMDAPEPVPASFRLEAPEMREYFAGPAPGDPAPDVAFTLADGREVSLSDLRGSVVALDFWATWCLPCRPAMRHLQELYEEHRDDGLVAYGLRWQDAPSDPSALLEELGVTYPIGDGMPFTEPFALSSYGIPTLYVIDREGNVSDVVNGYEEGATEEQVRAAIEAALRS